MLLIYAPKTEKFDQKMVRSPNSNYQNVSILAETDKIIVGKGPNGACFIRFNPAEYTDLSPFYAKRVVTTVYTHNRKPVQLDIQALLPIVVRLPETAFRTYMYLLSLLNDNRYIIRAKRADIRENIGNPQMRWIAFALHRLEQVGLIFRAKSRKNPNAKSQYSFIINPVFAWVGDQRDYLDLSGIDPE